MHKCAFLAAAVGRSYVHASLCASAVERNGLAICRRPKIVHPPIIRRSFSAGRQCCRSHWNARQRPYSNSVCTHYLRTYVIGQSLLLQYHCCRRATTVQSNAVLTYYYFWFLFHSRRVRRIFSSLLYSTDFPCF